MGINSPSEITANLQIGPTDAGTVRLYIHGDGIEIPMDFEPEEALEIAEEIRLAAERAAEMSQAAGRKGGKPGKPAGGNRPGRR